MGILSAEAGKRFRKEVLSMGGSRPAMNPSLSFEGESHQLKHF